MKQQLNLCQRGLSLVLASLMAGSALIGPAAVASSHMDAPLITLDPAANTTDVYAFVRMAAGQKVLADSKALELGFMIRFLGRGGEFRIGLGKDKVNAWIDSNCRW